MPEPTVSGRQFAFLLVDKFSMFSLAAAIDAFRSANRLLGRDFYSWSTVSAARLYCTEWKPSSSALRPLAPT